MVWCPWVDGRDIDMDGDKFSFDDGWECWVNGDIISGMTVEMLSERWQGLWDDSSERIRSSGVQSSDKLIRSIYGARHVLSLGWLVSRIETSLRLPCTSPIKTTTLPLIPLLLENTLSERVRHLCQRPVCSTPASLSLIRSLLSSVSDSIRSICFFFFSFFSFNPSLFLEKFYVFLHPSPFFNPSVLGSVTTCRQCLVR